MQYEFLAHFILSLIMLIGLGTVLTCIIIRWQHESTKKMVANVHIQRFLRCTWWLIGKTGSKWRHQYNEKNCLNQPVEATKNGLSSIWKVSAIWINFFNVYWLILIGLILSILLYLFILIRNRKIAGWINPG